MAEYLVYVNQQWVGDAKYWAGRLAEGCGWPQELRRFGPKPEL